MSPSHMCWKILYNFCCVFQIFHLLNPILEINGMMCVTYIVICSICFLELWLGMWEACACTGSKPTQ